MEYRNGKVSVAIFLLYCIIEYHRRARCQTFITFSYVVFTFLHTTLYIPDLKNIVMDRSTCGCL